MESLYLFYGQEEYLLEESVKKIKKSFNELLEGINLIKIDESNVNQLISNIETPCFGFDKKLIIVRNSGLLKKEGKKKNAYISGLVDKISEYIKENIESIKQDNVIIFIEEEVEKNKLYKVIEEYGKVHNFESEKLPNLVKRVKSIALAYKVQISDVNAKYFIECCGTSLQDIINELRKLIEYVGENGEIQKQDIDVLTTKQIDSVIFDLTDNLGKKDIKKAMEVFYNLIYQKEPVQKILITLYNHFKKLYIVKIAQDYNENITEALKLKPNQSFLISKYRTQAGYFKQGELRKILEELSDLDYKYKVGLIDLNVGIEAILCNYCG
nr:DNA polymerase III subunit delta [Clostridia bacterium]